MRILVTINCHGVDASAAGGIAIAEMISGIGHKVLVQTPDGGPVSIAAREKGLDTAGLGLRKSAVITGLLPFRKLIRRFQPDIIITTRADGQTASALIARGVPLVRVRCDIRKPRTGRLWEFIDNRTDLVVFPSDFMVERGYAGERTGITVVIPHPVDTDLFAPEITQGDYSVRLISIGRLSPMKGHRTLIRALTLLPEEIQAVIVGPASQQSPEDLMKYADDLGVAGRLTLPGRVEDVRSFMITGSIGVVTSLGSEVISRAGMEMMSMALPLVVSATNGLLDLVDDGETALLHSPGNHRQLAAQVRFLVDNPSMATRMGDRARKRCIERLSYPVVSKLWNDVLGELESMEQDCRRRVP